MKAERLGQWMRKHPERVYLYRLNYIGVEAGDEQLGEWDAVSLNARGTLCETIVESAQTHCDEMGQSCRYRVAGFDKKGASLVATTMRQQPEGNVPLGGLSVEDASASGVTGQAIRHNEMLMQMFLKSFGQMLNVQHAQVEQLQKAMSQYQRREAELLDLARAMALAGEDGVAKERAADRWDRLVSACTDKLGPAVLKEMGLLPDSFGKDEGGTNGASVTNGVETVVKAAEAVANKVQGN